MRRNKEERVEDLASVTQPFSTLVGARLTSFFDGEARIEGSHVEPAARCAAASALGEELRCE